MPYRGIPSVPGLAPFDLVCLDEDHRVIQELELFSTVGYVQLESRTASALVLPARTIHLSHSQPGDELVICFREEMERRFERVAGKDGHVRFAPRSASRTRAATLSVDRHSVPPAPIAVNETIRQPELATQMQVQVEEAESQDEKKVPWRARFLRWLLPDRRRAYRHLSPPLVAYRWTGANPTAHRIGNISETGLYLLTEERWSPGTMITMTLQRANSSGDNPADSIAVQTRVVRWDSNGEGLNFVLSSLSDAELAQTWQAGATSKRALKRFLRSL